MPRPGEVLDDRYEVLEAIGSGGTATVHRARDRRLDRPVALKVLLPSLAADDALAARFEGEAQALAAISHPAVVAVYDVARGDRATGREPYYVMELCEGGSLASAVRTGRRLDPGTLIPAIAAVAGGVAELHARGLVHRDVKPSNILLSTTGPRLADFGIVRSIGSDSGGPPTLVGTLAFLSPEVLRGQDAGRPADVYALGCIAFLGLTGRPPRVVSSVAELSDLRAEAAMPVSVAEPGLGRSFDAAVASALDPDPDGRPDALAFASALAGSLGAWNRAGRPGAPRPGEAPALAAPVGSVISAVASPSRALASPTGDGAESGPDQTATALDFVPDRRPEATTVAMAAVAAPPAPPAGSAQDPTPPAIPRSTRVSAVARRFGLPVVAGLVAVAAVVLLGSAIAALIGGSAVDDGGSLNVPSTSPAAASPSAVPSTSASPAASPSPAASAERSPFASADPTAVIAAEAAEVRAAIDAARGGRDGLRGRDANDLQGRLGSIEAAVVEGAVDEAADQARELLDRSEELADDDLAEDRGDALVAAVEALIAAIDPAD